MTGLFSKQPVINNLTEYVKHGTELPHQLPTNTTAAVTEGEAIIWIGSGACEGD